MGVQCSATRQAVTGAAPPQCQRRGEQRERGGVVAGGDRGAPLAGQPEELRGVELLGGEPELVSARMRDDPASDELPQRGHVGAEVRDGGRRR